MTPETLARLRAMGIELDDGFDFIANNLQNHKLNQQRNKELSIKLVSCTSDKDNFFLKFSIKTLNLENLSSNIYIAEVNRVLPNSTLVSSNVKLANNSYQSYKQTISKKKINSLNPNFEYGGFEFRGYLTCDGIAVMTEEFKLVDLIEKAKESRIIEPKVTKVKPLILNNKQKQQFITVVLGETQNGDKNLWDIVWVYFNLVQNLGFEKAMKRSSFYNKKPDNYKLFMYISGEGDEFKNDKMDNGVKIKDWVETEYFKNGLLKKSNLFKQFVADNVFVDEPLNPYFGWEGQGYWADLNLLPPKSNEKWYQARQYYWLQIQEHESVKYKYIKILENGFSTSFIFDEKKIIQFFKDNKELLPKDYSKIKKFYYERD